MRDKIFLLFVMVMILMGSGFHYLEYSTDEARGWLIATSSLSEWSKIFRYEGHPPLWYALLKILSLFSSSPVMIQVLSAVAGFTSLAVFYYKSPFTTFQKFLLCLNVYIFYQYTVIARLYALEVTLLFLACAAFPLRMQKPWRFFIPLWSLCLTSMFGLGYAFIFFGEYAWSHFRHPEKRGTGIPLVVTVAISLIILAGLLGSAGDSYAVHQIKNLELLNLTRWEKIFSFLGASIFLILVPGKVWNQALGLDHGYGNQIYLGAFLIFLAIVLWSFRRSVRGIYFFLGTGAVTIVLIYLIRFSSFNPNYYGHVTLAWLAATWIVQSSGLREKVHVYLLTFVLFLQAGAGVLSLAEDFRKPFSQGKNVGSYLDSQGIKEVIPGLWAFSSSYLVHSNAVFLDEKTGVLRRFRVVSNDVFSEEEYRHGIIPRAFTGIINPENFPSLISRIRERHCEGIPNLRVITNSALPEKFMDFAGLNEEKRFTGSIHPLESFYIYAFRTTPESASICRGE